MRDPATPTHEERCPLRGAAEMPSIEESMDIFDICD